MSELAEVGKDPAKWEETKKKLYKKYGLDKPDKDGRGPIEQMATNDCPKVQPQSKQQAQDNLGRYIQAAGIKSCKTAQTKTDSSFSGSGGGVMVPCGAMAVHVQGSAHSESHASDGCEQVAANAMSYYDASQNLSCILNSTINQSEMNSDTKQEVDIKVNGDMKNSSVNIDQEMGSKLALVANLNNEQKMTIAKDIQKVVSQRATMLQQAKSTNGAIPVGGKSLQGFTSTKNDINTTSSINKAMNSLVEKNKNNQKFTLWVNGNMEHSAIGGNQKNVVDMMGQSLMGNVTKVEMKEVNKALTAQDTVLKQISEASDENGSDWVGKIITGLIIMAVLFGCYTLWKKQQADRQKEIAASTASGPPIPAPGAPGPMANVRPAAPPNPQYRPAPAPQMVVPPAPAPQMVVPPAPVQYAAQPAPGVYYPPPPPPVYRTMEKFRPTPSGGSWMIGPSRSYRRGQK